MKDGYVELLYPEDSDTPDAVGVVRAEHVDAYLADGWRVVPEPAVEED